MTITLTKTRLALSILVVALLVPATAYATHIFDDVVDSKFYAEPVEWAANNNITTGKTPDTFAPEDNVTRGESVTFLKRFNDNIVQPGDVQLQSAIEGTNDVLEQAQADIDAAEAQLGALPELHWATIAASGSVLAASAGVNQDTAETGVVGGLAPLGLATGGEYEVDFNLTTVAGCHAMVSLSNTNTLSLGGSSIQAVQRIRDRSSLYISITDEAGDPISSDFTVQLWCGGNVLPTPDLPQPLSADRPEAQP